VRPSVPVSLSVSFSLSLPLLPQLGLISSKNNRTCQRSVQFLNPPLIYVTYIYIYIYDILGERAQIGRDSATLKDLLERTIIASDVPGEMYSEW
jgi:hypothetical protein